jgi:hypothetical protein
LIEDKKVEVTGKYLSGFDALDIKNIDKLKAEKKQQDRENKMKNMKKGIDESQATTDSDYIYAGFTSQKGMRLNVKV